MTILPAAAGWYTFKHKFRNVGGSAEIAELLLEGTLLNTWGPLPNLGSPIGGNRYGWLPVDDIGLSPGSK